ncbi:transposase for insertion sequence element IS21-like protein [Parapedobacter defluvii]|uniref:Transposase for insertion sequence element IS21-like protein n=1 Tax=Parapedobacter defluvii TaxID=2045106 RepID=A0ABQ1N0X3_9SPHI|nr:IS21 family transposase [Parapedobacter defluvii]GGC50449.1 transposase for insertion sequence element IS21-like protein [Parapedobacter defluvii]
MNYYLHRIMLYHHIHKLSRQGRSVSWISSEVGLNWRTVKRLLSMDERTFQEDLERGRTREKILDPYEGFLRDRLSLYPDTSAAQLHDWLKEHHAGFPQVSQKTVFNYVQYMRDKYNIPREDSARQYMAVEELPYGRQGQADFGFYNMRTTAGGSKKVQFFTFVLSRSRHKYVQFSDVPFTCELLVEAHERAFEFIGGVPVEVVYDQDRLMMVSENLGDIILTREFRAYVGQRGITTWFCRRADPESKGKVENVVKYVKRNFLYNRHYRDLETLNDEAVAWLHRTANNLPHGTTGKVPREELQIELASLNPFYPVTIPQPEYPVHAVRRDNTISWKGNLYSVPLGTYAGPGTTVAVKPSGEGITVLDAAGSTLCTHRVSPLKGQKIILTDHKRDKGVAIAEMMEKLAAMMPDREAAMQWLELIKQSKPRYIRDQLQALTETVGGLEPQVAARALEYCMAHGILGAADFRAVASKLIAGTRPQQTETKVVRLNPLGGGVPGAGIQPDRSSISDYETLLGRS